MVKEALAIPTAVTEEAMRILMVVEAEALMVAVVQAEILTVAVAEMDTFTTAVVEVTMLMVAVVGAVMVPPETTKIIRTITWWYRCQEHRETAPDQVAACPSVSPRRDRGLVFWD